MYRVLLFVLFASAVPAQKIPAPRIWTDKDLAQWATPVATLNVRPAHFSEHDYYAATPGEWVRTYPVYFPGREPEGYWEMLRNKKPEPIITPGKRTKAEWIKAGQIVFRELDVSAFRSYDPEVIAKIRSAEAFSKVGGQALKDGTVVGMRWAPTSKGLALTVQECSGCHTRVLPDGSTLDGAPANDPGNGVLGEIIQKGVLNFFAGEDPIIAGWRGFAVPWVPNDIHSAMKTMGQAEIDALLRSNIPGTFPRFNGSPYYTTKIPDLIGVAERKFIDHTATHTLRNSGDIMRYAALVTCCDIADFGPHRMLNEKQRVVFDRIPDEAVFALAEYIVSLNPPTNPNAGDPLATAGKKIFASQGCATCHAAPFYTNNKLTLAQGYQPPKDHPLAADIMPLSVGTDSGLALKTRKGTGLYKVPSLKGVWYRGLYNHDGSIASLEDWFNPARLRDDYVPSGFIGYGIKTRAVKGHEFGLTLPADDKKALIAFLRTL